MTISNANLYNWPANLKEVREQRILTVLPEENNLQLLIGSENIYSFSVICSSDEITIAKMILPTNRYSEIEAHEGDEFLNVLKGRLIVTVFTEEENTNPDSVSRYAYQINPGEKMFIPEGCRHMYKNLTPGNVEAVVAIAPRL